MESNKYLKYLKEHVSVASTVFNNDIIFQHCDTAQPPFKDYAQIIVSKNKVVYRCWKIIPPKLSGSQLIIYPTEIVNTYEDFIHDDKALSEIHRCFGVHMMEYVRELACGKYDYLFRMPESVLCQIITNLPLGDIHSFSSTCRRFHQLCNKDSVWKELFIRTSKLPLDESLTALAKEKTWKRLYFTDKISLRSQLRRQKLVHGGAGEAFERLPTLVRPLSAELNLAQSKESGDHFKVNSSQRRSSEADIQPTCSQESDLVSTKEMKIIDIETDVL